MNISNNPHPRVAVIGAGIAGLATAYELKQRGIEAQVFEETDRAGGRMMTKEVDGLLFDAGALFFSENYTQMKAYANQFNIPWVPYEKHCAQRFMRNGKTHILHLRGIQDILRQPLLSIPARAALLRWLMHIQRMKTQYDFFDLSTIPPVLDRRTAADHVNQSVHSEVNDYITDPFTGAMQFHRSDELSAGAVIALLQMSMSYDRKFTPRYTTGGIVRIADALAKRVSINLNSNIKSIETLGDTVCIRFDDGASKTFDAVVLTVPAYVAAKLLKKPTAEQQRVFDAARYAATITVALKVPTGLSDISHCTYVPYKENAIIGSYTFENNKSSGFENAKSTVVNVYLREDAAERLMYQPDRLIYEEVIKQFFSVCPEARGHEHEITSLALQRWPNAMPKFNHGYISTVRNFVEHHQGDGNIYLAGDYLNAPWTEGAARSGIRAGKAVSESVNRSGNSEGRFAMSSSSVGAVLPL